MLFAAQQLMMNGLKALMLDVYPSTLPGLLIGKKISNVIGASPFIRINKYDGVNVLDTADFAFGSDGLFPEQLVLSWVGADQGIMETAWAHNLPGIYFTQANPTLRPVVVESNQVNRNSAGRIAPRFKLGDYMEIPNSLAMFNALHQGVNTSYCVIAQRDNGTTRGMVAGNRYSAGEEGHIVGEGTFFNQPNRATARHEVAALKANYVTGSAADNVSHVIWVNTDLLNAIPGERIEMYIDGVLNANNPQSFTDAPGMNNASNNLRWGTGATGWEYAGKSEGLFYFSDDQRQNRTQILSYL